MSTSESIPLTSLAEGTGFEGHNAVVSSQVYLLSEAAGVAHLYLLSLQPSSKNRTPNPRNDKVQGVLLLIVSCNACI